MANAAEGTNTRIGRPPVEEQRQNRIFKALTSEWEKIRENAKTFNYKSASDYIRETTLNTDKWFNIRCLDAILNKAFSQVVFEKSDTEKVIVKAEPNTYIISHVVNNEDRAYIELASKEDIAQHLYKNGYDATMLINKN